MESWRAITRLCSQTVSCQARTGASTEIRALAGDVSLPLTGADDAAGHQCAKDVATDELPDPRT